MPRLRGARANTFTGGGGGKRPSLLFLRAPAPKSPPALSESADGFAVLLRPPHLSSLAAPASSVQLPLQLPGRSWGQLRVGFARRKPP